MRGPFSCIKFPNCTSNWYYFQWPLGLLFKVMIHTLACPSTLGSLCAIWRPIAAISQGVQFIAITLCKQNQIVSVSLLWPVKICAREALWWQYGCKHVQPVTAHASDGLIKPLMCDRWGSWSEWHATCCKALSYRSAAIRIKPLISAYEMQQTPQNYLIFGIFNDWRNLL